MNSRTLSLVHTGTVLEEDSLSLGEISLACGAHADWIIGLVEESILEPQGNEICSWRFSGTSLLRARSAQRLERDLGVNIAGIALALDLLGELENLRTQIAKMGIHISV